MKPCVYFSVVLMYRKCSIVWMNIISVKSNFSGCQSMIAWFSDVTESDTKKIMCHTYIKQATLYSGYIYCWYYYCYNLAYGYFPSSVSGSCMVYMHISTNKYNGFYLTAFFFYYLWKYVLAFDFLNDTHIVSMPYGTNHIFLLLNKICMNKYVLCTFSNS